MANSQNKSSSNEHHLDVSRNNVLSEGTYERLPILPLKRAVMFPKVSLPIAMTRQKSIEACQAAYRKDKWILALTQREETDLEPDINQLYEVGTLCSIDKIVRLPQGGMNAIIKGHQRVKLNRFHTNKLFYEGRIEPYEEDNSMDQKSFSAVMEDVRDSTLELMHSSNDIKAEALYTLKNINDPLHLLNFVAVSLPMPSNEKQELLRESAIVKRLEAIQERLKNELQIIELKRMIHEKTREDIEQQQRNFFLTQQLKTIQEELGTSQNNDLERFKEDLAGLELSDQQLKAHFDRELQKLERMHTGSPEYGSQTAYLEFALHLPWSKSTEDRFDLKYTREVLDKHHYGLKHVKERIVEYLAVLKLKRDAKAPILCLVGPPGVGKTSLGQSIAEALGRSYTRMAFGGLHDEAEIRGHRKTYIGAKPGRILQSLKRAECNNPVFVLDEIDKIGKDFRGDPSSALLEMLDPEQNVKFYDNYLEYEFDLSNVFFIATANDLASIPLALRDRLEVIEVQGYSMEEKLEIATQHLIPQQRDNHGLTAKQIKIDRKVLPDLIQGYTRESGVRQLKRVIGALMRSRAKDIVEELPSKSLIRKPYLVERLGPPKFAHETALSKSSVGVATGLAYTPVGGDLLFIEASLHRGESKLKLTGNLGNVMKESAEAAYTFLQSYYQKNNDVMRILDECSIHIHVPAGATPKDGPSAGIALLVCMASLLTNRPVNHKLALSGEITLRGEVLPVGGIREKLLAARRYGVTEVLLCGQNAYDVKEIDEDHLQGLKITFVEHMNEVIDTALLDADE